MDAATAALEELLRASDDSATTNSGAAAVNGGAVGRGGGGGGGCRGTLSALGWHTGLMGPHRGHEGGGGVAVGTGDLGRYRGEHELSMSSSSLPGDDVTSTTPPPATNSCLPGQLSPGSRSGIGSNSGNAAHPTNSIRGKWL